MRIVDVLLPVIGSALLLALAVTMVSRRLHQEYRFFFAYTVISLLSTVSLFLVAGKANCYLYWLLNGLNAVLVLFPLNEAFFDVFHPFYSFWWFRLIFPFVTAAAGLLAVQNALIHPFAGQFILSVSFAATGAISFIQAGTFLILMFLVFGLHVRCRRYPYYIALGFAISSIGDWAGHVFASNPGWVFRYAPPLAYLCATLVWLWAFTAKFEADSRLEFSRTSQANSTPKLKVS